MPAFYRATVPDFLAAFESELTGRLSTAYARSGFTNQKSAQTLTWAEDMLRLRVTLAEVLAQVSAVGQWSILLEFAIPRKEKRIDVVLLAGARIVLLELKHGAAGLEAVRQVEEYALLLHFFHQPSHSRHISCFVVSSRSHPAASRTQMFLPITEAPAYWVSPAERVTWRELVHKLTAIAQKDVASLIDLTAWDEGEYRPIPTIIDAALALQAGLSIREIAHARAARYDVDQLTYFVASLIEEAREKQKHTICFVTGVPGSGKTLVGLNLAFSRTSRQEPIHFMSGTGPLVKVLQAAMAEHHRKRQRVSAAESRLHARTLIENVHVFAHYYTEDNLDRAPSNHVIIFDEAQRAWDRQQNLSKFARNYSEPEMLLRIMERHQDWAVVIALVGGGQEINNGEAGLEEWGRALTTAARPWRVYASPEALEGGKAVAGSQLFRGMPEHTVEVHAEARLHLDVSIRSLRADTYSAWVNEVVLGHAGAARLLADQSPFAVLLTRSLTDLRLLLKEHSLGESRSGLVGSSGAARIRAEGLEPDSSFHGAYPWHHWYLADSTDVRSSHQLEVFATEFEIQGLELDWIGLLWGGDFIWSDHAEAWIARSFAHKRQSAWSPIRSERRQIYRRNAYRVLLTRARQGIVLYVPAGDPTDPTRSPEEFDATAEFLLRCGVRAVEVTPLTPKPGSRQSSLFDEE
jgi:hypothetical protein